MARLQLTWLIISLVLIIFSFGTVGQFVGPNPEEQAVEGNDITLRCRAGVEELADSGWSRNALTIANINGLLSVDPRYSNFAIDNADTAIGQMDLVITNVQYEDGGDYTCEFTTASLQQNYAQKTTLTVEVAAESLTMTVNGTVGEFNILKDGVETEAVCTVLGARPALGIDWYLGDTLMTGANVMNNMNVNDPNTSDTISSLWFTKVKCTQTIRCKTTGQFATPSLSQTQALASLGVGSIIGIAAPGPLAVMMLLIGLALQE